MRLRKKISYISFIAFFILILSGCTQLKQLDSTIGLLFFNDNATGTPAEAIGGRTATSSLLNTKGLTEAQKITIEDWLTKHGLNRYGDPEGTYYDGGTPLLDEITGQAIERFEYILKNHPDIFND